MVIELSWFCSPSCSRQNHRSRSRPASRACTICDKNPTKSDVWSSWWYLCPRSRYVLRTSSGCTSRDSAVPIAACGECPGFSILPGWPLFQPRFQPNHRWYNWTSREASATRYRWLFPELRELRRYCMPLRFWTWRRSRWFRIVRRCWQGIPTCFFSGNVLSRWKPCVPGNGLSRSGCPLLAWPPRCGQCRTPPCF